MILSALLNNRVNTTGAKLVPIIINQILVLRFFDFDYINFINSYTATMRFLSDRLTDFQLFLRH